MLQARLREIMRDLRASQKILMETTEFQSTAPVDGRARQTSLIPRFWASQGVDLRTALLEPLNMNVTVGGVEVTGVLAWVQRKLVNARALHFNVYLEKNRAVITGSLDALDATDDALRIELKNGQSEEKVPLDVIADSVAYELVRRLLSKDPTNKLEVLDREEFKTLLTLLIETARLNRAILLGRPARQKFADLFPQAAELATQVPEWYQLNYLTASIAESAENREKALFFYEKVKEVIPKAGTSAVKIDPSVIKAVEEKIAKLRPQIQKTLNVSLATAREKILEDASYAVQVLNTLFKSDRKVPGFEFLGPEMKNNAYWTGETYYAPPEVQDIPDVTYHEMAHFFIQDSGRLPYQGQYGAIVQSYAAVLASLVKQTRLQQTATTANWLLGEGFAAWLTGKDVKKEKDKSALMSLKEPGSAYDDPVLGKDPQPKHMKDYVETQVDNGGVHINSGIVNKAFYETAIRIGSDRAGAIWVEALPKVVAAKKIDFSTLAKLTYEIASSNPADQQAVREAWAVVGLDPTLPSQTNSRMQ